MQPVIGIDADQMGVERGMCSRPTISIVAESHHPKQHGIFVIYWSLFII
jgi:hypothetical protein